MAKVIEILLPQPWPLFHKSALLVAMAFILIYHNFIIPYVDD